MAIDLRSDTVTRPGPAMRRAMATAEVGDDVYGDDPTVNALESLAAELLGKEAGLYVSSGTQSNLCALLSHCQRGDAYVVGQTAHNYRYEAGGAAVLGGIQPQPLALAPDGTFDLDALAGHMVTDHMMYHFAISRLLSLENTYNGVVLDPGYVTRAQGLARSRGLALHLDGARLWHAAVELGVSPATVAEGFDTVSVCLSKGLGAPVGSVLVGSSALIGEARRWRKMLGGGMRQAGVIAAAGIHALENNIERLAEDHLRAARLAEGLETVPGVTVTSRATNMVFIRLGDIDPRSLQNRLSEAGIIVSAAPEMRLVTHLDISDDDVETVIGEFTRAVAD